MYKLQTVYNSLIVLDLIHLLIKKKKKKKKIDLKILRRVR
jgi:hypothetical protein